MCVCVFITIDYKYMYTDIHIRLFMFVYTYTHVYIIIVFHQLQIYMYGGCPRGTMVKAMDSRIVVSEFEHQLCYYVHFWTNTFGKGMNPLFLPTMG